MERISRLFRVLRALAKLEPWARHSLGLKFSELVNPGHFYGEFGKTWISNASYISPPGLSSYQRQRRLDRLWMLDQLSRTMSPRDGDIAEMGVYRGQSAWVMLRANKDASYWGYDSFEGLSEPDPLKDGKYWSSGDLSSTFLEASSILSEFGSRITLVKGWIPMSFESNPVTTKLGLIHIDVDLFEPTLASLYYADEFAHQDTIIVCDDFGFVTCPGATSAVMEFLHNRKTWNLISLPTGQALLNRKRD